MARDTTSASKIIHSPMLLEWTEEKLRSLDQDQLLNLLANLDRQRAIGRVSEATAVVLDQRISALLTKRNGTKRRNEVSKVAAAQDVR
jgi:hypothetical protein